MSALLELSNIRKTFRVGNAGRQVDLHAVRDVNLEVNPGETLAIVGESGCGKTTLGRVILRLIPASSGTLRFDGNDITSISTAARRKLAGDMQIVFQDPYSALNPRMKVGDIIAEPLVNFGMPGAKIAERVAEVMETVRLPHAYADRYPHAFSGGQRQRIGIARALAVKPRLIVCDEAVSALDVSVQAQILTLLKQVQDETGVALVFISHNLGVVRFLAHRVAVMYLGSIVEQAPSEQLFTDPRHPYTAALLDAIPEPDLNFRGKRKVIEGDIPSPIDPPPGCPFHQRCAIAQDICRVDMPTLSIKAPKHDVACHFAEMDQP